MQKGRWKIDCDRFSLDANGKGQALYRIDASGTPFHFLVISDVFPADQKVDRAFGINWDVSAAICEGDWSQEREDILTEEIPKQYDGRYDEDVLCFCRGNRSERVFDDVVEALAGGRQPDVAMLASVGYLLRSTAFAGNGLFGMRPYEGLGSDHPLGEPYLVQMLAAYMMREFVFALVDHLAHARNPAAEKLNRRIKRYLGLGNSAGLGLVPFIAGHPLIIHHWALTHETALAEAMDRPARKPDLQCALPAFIAKAVAYFRQDQRDGNAIFADYARLADELAAVADAVDHYAQRGGEVSSWRKLFDSILPTGLHPETIEIVNSILLELYPDIVEKYEDKLSTKEDLDILPCMTVAELRQIIATNYDWLLRTPAKPGALDYFWYYPLESPYEPRRGRRGMGSPFEYETAMDLPMRLPLLVSALATAPAEETVGVFAARHLEFASIVARVQSTDGRDYAELRDNTLAADFLPFAACRFLLAFYGMEKYDPRMPRSTKGALLQGAPLADEIESGIAGDWPFPLAPGNPSGQERQLTVVPLRLLEQPEISIHSLKERTRGKLYGGYTSDEVRLFPPELRKLLTRACLGRGLSVATAEAVYRLSITGLTLGCETIDGLLKSLESNSSDLIKFIDSQTIDADGAPAFTVAAPVLYLACANVMHSDNMKGIAYGRNIASSDLIHALPYWGARNGYLSLIADCVRGQVTVAGADGGAFWLAEINDLIPDWATGRILERREKNPVKGPGWPALLQGVRSSMPSGGSAASFALMCLPERTDAALARNLRDHLEKTGLATRFLCPQDVKHRETTMIRSGIMVPSQDFARLTKLAKAALMLENDERNLMQ